MLDTAGKLPEKLMKSKPIDAINAVGDFSIKELVQTVRLTEVHGDYSQRMALLVTLVIRNAFNSGRRCVILKLFERLRFQITFCR